MEEICRLTNHEATQVYELIEKRNALSNLKKLREGKEKKIKWGGTNVSGIGD